MVSKIDGGFLVCCTASLIATILFFAFLWYAGPSNSESAVRKEIFDSAVSACEVDPLYVGQIESCVRLKLGYTW